jgi:hypothetical protein
MILEGTKITKKIVKVYERVYFKAERFFSHEYFSAFLFLFLLFFLFFKFFKTHTLIQQFYLSAFSFIFSLIVIFLLFKFNKVIPVVLFGSALIFFSFFQARFDFGVEYNLFYFSGFSLLSASILYSLIKQKREVFWFSLLLLFVASLSPLLSAHVLIGDERILLDNLSKLETGKFLPSDFGEHNYVNVSFVYFYYLVIIAKIFGVSVESIFFVLKFFFLLLIFLSFYLISTRFIDEKLALFVVLVAFFPIQNLHLAPQMIGKFIIFLVFIYFYLKYFRQLNSRIILVVMMLLITYINLTTLYISLAVFAFFVFVFFFKKAISRKAYFTDLVILFLFVILVGTYSASIDLFGLAEKYSDIQVLPYKGEEKPASEAIVKEEDLSSKVDPFAKKAEEISGEELIPETEFKDVPFVRRVVPFLNNYVRQFGLEQLFTKMVNYVLLSVLVLTAFFLYPDKRQVFVFSLAIFFLVLFLIHIQFQDGVHATLEVTSLIFGVCMVLIFYKKPFYFIPLMLLVFSSASAPLLFDVSQYAEANLLFNVEYTSHNILGENLVSVTKSNAINSNQYFSDSGFLVSCVNSKPFEFYLNGIYLRCDYFGRIGYIGEKIYENEYSKAYIVSAEKLKEIQKN